MKNKVAKGWMIALCLFTQAVVFAQNEVRVTVKEGTLEGVDSSGVKVFRGIPYAAPPVGDLRWKAPQPTAVWKGVRSAKEFGPNPMQDNGGLQGYGTPKISEDCLYLNVWTPAKTKDDRLPVLVYINGGALVVGSGSDPVLGGMTLARRGIVAVTFNYREGIFGFFTHPELSAENGHHTSGNYGFLDQVAALRWIQRNIGAFGGDPARVTIVGESAGSLSVSALMASPLAKGLFAQAMGSSGSILGRKPIPTQQERETYCVEKMKQMGCGSISEMRKLSAEELMRKASNCGYLHYYHTDNLFMPEQPRDIYEAGRQQHIPLLVGGNSLESAPKDIFPNAWKERRLPTMTEILDVATYLFGKEHAKEMLELYGIKKESDILMQPGRALCNDYHIAYGTWCWADLHRRTGNAPVYRYYYSHPLPEEPQGAVATSIDLLWQQANRGACHGADIGYAMGTLSTVRYHKWQAEDWFVSDIFNGYYVNFIKTGDTNGLGLPEWIPTNGADTPCVMNIDVICKMTVDSLEERRYARMNNLFKP